MARVIAVVNQKGGVGKTTTTINLGAALVQRGRRVLLVDLDPQGHTTMGVGLSVAEGQPTICDVLVRDQPLCKVVLSAEGLDVAPAQLDLAAAEMELVSAPGREIRLREALGEIDHHYVLIDCPPSLGLLTLNALAAAQEVLVPVQSQYYSYTGFVALLNAVKQTQKWINRQLTVAGILITQFDGRIKLHRETVDHLREEFDGHYRVFQTVIPQAARAQEAAQAAVPIVRYDPRSPAAMAYIALVEELDDLDD
jgi:chromosome partitioning protein